MSRVARHLFVYGPPGFGMTQLVRALMSPTNRTIVVITADTTINQQTLPLHSYMERASTMALHLEQCVDRFALAVSADALTSYLQAGGALVVTDWRSRIQLSGAADLLLGQAAAHGGLDLLSRNVFDTPEQVTTH